MRKFKFMSKAVVGMMAVAMTMGSLSGVAATQPMAVYAEEATLKSLQISAGYDYNYGSLGVYAAPGNTLSFSVAKTGSDDKPFGGTVTLEYSMSGAKLEATADDQKEENKDTTWKKEKTYIDKTTGELHIGTKETTDKITVTVKSGSVSASLDVNVFAGVLFIPNYQDMSNCQLCTTADDTFFFLEVLKKSGDQKGSGTVYCFESKNKRCSVDLSSLKLSKDVYVLVYGDQNTKPLDTFKIPAQPKKPSVKYVAGKDTVEESFTVKSGSVEDLQYFANDHWEDVINDEDEYDGLTMGALNDMTIMGTTLSVRCVTRNNDKELTAPASPEVKVKIAAAPKAPKVTFDYAKNGIKFAKECEVRIPGWEVPTLVTSSEAGTDGEGKDITITNYFVGWAPFYYQIGTGKEDLNPSPEAFAETLVDAYIEAYNKAVDALDAKQKISFIDWAKGESGTELASKDEIEEVEGFLEESRADLDGYTHYLTDDEKTAAKLDQTVGEVVAVRKLTTADETVEVTEESKKVTYTISGSNDKEYFLDGLTDGYTMLVRTKKGKKAASQPAFSEVKAAPEIQISQKKVGTENVKDEEGNDVMGEDGKTPLTKDIMQDENIVVLMKDDGTYSDNKLTFTWSEESLKLTPSGSGATFAYTLDGSKYSKLTKETTIKLDKIDKSKGVVVRTEGAKGDKSGAGAAWASNTIKLPVVAKELAFADSNKKEITIPKDATDAKETYTITAKDFFDNDISKDVKWSVEGIVEANKEKIVFDAEAHTLTVKKDAAAATVKITVSHGDKTATIEVKVVAPAADAGSEG